MDTMNTTPTTTANEAPKVKRERKPRVAPVPEAKTAKVKAASPNSTVANLPALPALPKAARKPKPLHDCECGCGGQTHSRFVPGHDSRLHAWILRVERDVIKLADVQPEGTRKVVAARMKAQKSTAAA